MTECGPNFRMTSPTYHYYSEGKYVNINVASSNNIAIPCSAFELVSYTNNTGFGQGHPLGYITLGGEYGLFYACPSVHQLHRILQFLTSRDNILQCCLSPLCRCTQTGGVVGKTVVAVSW